MTTKNFTMKMQMNLSKGLLLIGFCLMMLEGFGLDSLMIQRLSVPRAGDIYLIQEPNDSFSFFQIGNVDSTDLIPIIKGAYLVKDAFLNERTVKNMDTHFPDYFDTSDIYSIPRSELHTMNKAGKIAQIYRHDRYEVKPTEKNYSFYLFTGFLFFLVNAGLICVYYAIIWLSNRGGKQFSVKSHGFQLLIISGITLLVSSLMLLNESQPIDYQELLFLLMNNLGVAFSLLGLYQFALKYFHKKERFLFNQLILFLLIIFGGGLIILFFQFLMIYLIDNKLEWNLDALFNFEIYNFNITFGLFNFIPLAISNTIYNFIQHQNQ